MAKKASKKGRLVIRFGVPIFLALAGGIGLGAYFEQTKHEKEIAAQLENLSSQTKVTSELMSKMVRRFYQDGRDQKGVMHWSLFHTESGKLSTPIDSYRAPSQGFNEGSYLNSLRRKIQPSNKEKPELLTFRLKPHSYSRTEWVVIAHSQFIYTDRHYRVRIALIDPMKAFPIFSKLAETQEQKAFLVTRGGRILAHTQPAYIGANYRNTDLFIRAISKLFLTDRPENKAGAFDSIDQMRVLAAFEKIQSLPFALVFEDTLTVSRGTGVRRLANEALGLITSDKIALILFLIAAASVISAIFRKPKAATVSTEKVTPLNNPNSWPAHWKQKNSLLLDSDRHKSALRKSVAESRGISIPRGVPTQGVPNQKPKAKSRKPNGPRELTAVEQVQKFQLEVARMGKKEQMLKKLADSTAILCQSPTLFFVFDPRANTARLAYDSGFRVGEAPAALSFQISKGAMEQILECAKAGKIASLGQYEPLTRLMTETMSISFFEAWAVTSLGRISGSKSSLIGVLIVVQPGIRSATNRDSLVRMMRTTANVYENSKVSPERVSTPKLS